MPTALAPGPVADLAPPNLDDPAKFRRVPRVPILDEHEHESKGAVDLDLLRLLASNTNRRCDRGDLVAITIGHTRDDVAESDQPPFVGYARDLAVGTFRDEPCLLADFYLRVEDADEALRYPHRSIERVRSPDPAQNYIDYVCLLRRPPERSLGLLTYARTLPAGADVVRYERDFPAADARPVPTPIPTTPQDQTPMTPEEIQAVATGVAAALAPAFDKIAAALAPPSTGADVAGTPPADDDDPDRVRNGESEPTGDNTFVPGVAPAGTVSAADFKKLQDERDGLQAQLNRAKYLQGFDAMEREGIILNRKRELDRLMSLPEPLREGHLATIRTCYARRPAGWKPSTEQPLDETAERKAIIDTATRYGITNYDDARARYHADRETGSVNLDSDEDRQGVIDYATKNRIFDVRQARAGYVREKYKA